MLYRSSRHFIINICYFFLRKKYKSNSRSLKVLQEKKRAAMFQALNVKLSQPYLYYNLKHLHNFFFLGSHSATVTFAFMRSIIFDLTTCFFLTERCHTHFRHFCFHCRLHCPLGIKAGPSPTAERERRRERERRGERGERQKLRERKREIQRCRHQRREGGHRTVA